MLLKQFLLGGVVFALAVSSQGQSSPQAAKDGTGGQGGHASLPPKVKAGGAGGQGGGRSGPQLADGGAGGQGGHSSGPGNVMAGSVGGEGGGRGRKPVAEWAIRGSDGQWGWANAPLNPAETNSLLGAATELSSTPTSHIHMYLTSSRQLQFTSHPATASLESSETIETEPLFKVDLSGAEQATRVRIIPMGDSYQVLKARLHEDTQSK